MNLFSSQKEFKTKEEAERVLEKVEQEVIDMNNEYEMDYQIDYQIKKTVEGKWRLRYLISREE